MRDLFELDMKDYDPAGTAYRRPSSRAIIVRDGKALMIYSEKYDYFKFPGGGIEDGETPQEAVIRETAEESGYRIIPSSIEEFGRVVRRNRDKYHENAYFEQENLYWFCEVEEEPGPVKLDGYEADEGFTPVWISLMDASRHNLYDRRKDGGSRIMMEREARVADLADIEYRKRERRKKEQAYIAGLGSLDFAGMLAFVEGQLNSDLTENIGAKKEIKYSRFGHTKRVLGWTKKLYDLSPRKESLRYEDLLIAAVFHDVGRNAAAVKGTSHALEGVPITREYLLGHGFNAERVEYICGLVAQHSDKHLMYYSEETDPNLLLLMEADLMDDMGALGIVMDCMITECRNPEAVFTDCLDHIRRYTYRIHQKNPMVTPKARALWDEKTKLVNEFTVALSADIELS